LRIRKTGDTSQHRSGITAIVISTIRTTHFGSTNGDFKLGGSASLVTDGDDYKEGFLGGVVLGIGGDVYGFTTNGDHAALVALWSLDFERIVLGEEFTLTITSEGGY